MTSQSLQASVDPPVDRLTRFADRIGRLIPGRDDDIRRAARDRRDRGPGDGHASPHHDECVSPRPLDAAALHDADDADPGPQLEPGGVSGIQAGHLRDVAPPPHRVRGVGGIDPPDGVTLLCLLGTGPHAWPSHCDSFRPSGREKRARHRLSVPAGDGRGRAGVVAVRAVRERAAAHEYAGQFSGEDHGADAASDDDLRASGAGVRGGLPASASS